MHSIYFCKMLKQNYFLTFLRISFSCYLFVFGFSSCEKNNTKKNIDVEHINVNFNSIRFDNEVIAMDTNDIFGSLNKIGNKYPEFTPIYFQELASLGKMQDQKMFNENLAHFLTSHDYRILFDSVKKYFPDTKKIDADILYYLKHLKFYFPKEPIGNVYYFVSGLNFWSAISVDSNIGIGLDMYLGKKFPFYASSTVQIPDYQVWKCEPEYIPINLARNKYEEKFPMVWDDKTLLDLMIYKGKQILFMEYMLPNSSIDKLLGYTPEQLKWCEENEAMIYNFFIQKNILYSNNWQDIARYINDGPNTAGMPETSPGNIGSWLGWKIINQYMNKNNIDDFHQIMKDKNSGQDILRKSKYKPY